MHLRLGQDALGVIHTAANASEMEAVLQAGLEGQNVTVLNVSRRSIDVNGGVEWDIAFAQAGVDIPLILATPRSLQSSSVAVTRVSRGSLVQGNFTLDFGFESVDSINAQITDGELKYMLNALPNIGKVNVFREGPGEFGEFNWTVEFIRSTNSSFLPSAGEQALLDVRDSNFSWGSVAVTRVQPGTPVPQGTFKLDYGGTTTISSF